MPCCVLPPSAETEKEFTLAETTPTSPSPGSYSPAPSVHSVGVSSASSPTAAVSPEYTGVTSTTGETGVAAQIRFQHTDSSFSAPTHLSLCQHMCLPGAVQSYTWSLTYTVTTAGGSTPEAGQQLSCMRNSAPVPPPSSTHRMPVYTHREEHG